MLVPLETELGATRAQVAGAYSLGLLMMALVAPAIGRRIDRDLGVPVMRVGLALALAGLVLLACVDSLTLLYLAWGVLGVAMGALLYEPAFGLVNRAIGDDAVRLRALSAVTVIGGLASTVFLPTLAVLVETLGWRQAALAGAVAVLLAGWRLERGVFAGLAPVVVELPVPPRESAAPRRPRGFVALSAIFVTGTVSGMALTVLLVPALIERGTPPTWAASALAALGLSQLPGRLWLLRVQRELPAGVLTTLPLVSQALGLMLVAYAPNAVASACGVVVFGAGAGLQTLLRPWLVRRLFGARDSGALNGHVARSQGVARAFAPLLAAGAATLFGTAAVFVALALLLAAMIPVARALMRAHAVAQDPAG